MAHLLKPRSDRPHLGWQTMPSVLLSVLAVGLLYHCSSDSSIGLERQQANNLRLTKALHRHFNQRNWTAVRDLCAETVRYRGRATQYTDVEESNAGFLLRYRATLHTDQRGTFEVRQLYPAGKHHVIAEGMVTTDSSAAPMPACLIYTIEDDHITRLYVY